MAFHEVILGHQSFILFLSPVCVNDRYIRPGDNSAARFEEGRHGKFYFLES
jgi:hypothetical protein